MLNLKPMTWDLFSSISISNGREVFNHSFTFTLTLKHWIDISQNNSAKIARFKLDFVDYVSDAL